MESRVAGRRFVSFVLDIGIGDAIVPPIEEIQGKGWLDFGGIPPARYAIISLEQQISEKIHALTASRGSRPNTRVKDLVDVLLLLQQNIEQKRLHKSLYDTFKRRATHLLPNDPPKIPEFWEPTFNKLASECRLSISFEEAKNTLSSH